MEIKEINRNIPENREDSKDRFRVKYKDKSKFDILVVNICRTKTNEILTFRFTSAELPKKDSIHFSTSVEKEKLYVHWKGITTNSNINKTKSQKDTENKNEIETKEIKSFHPIFGKTPEILILGTLPSKDSLQLNKYYANSRNIFWEIIYNLYKTKNENDYKSRTDFLKQNRISIWDVCHTALRKSSLDQDIKNEIPNDINGFIKSNPTIKTIAFNGRKSEKLYDKYFERLDKINYLTLLSTSPTNTSYNFNQKLENWKKIIKPSLSVTGHEPSSID